MLAAHYLDWHWVVGTGPVAVGMYDSDWLLPSELHVDQVKANEVEILDGEGQGKFTLRRLPHFTTDETAAFLLAPYLDRFTLEREAEGRWVFRQGDVLMVAERPALAIARGAYKLAKIVGWAA